MTGATNAFDLRSPLPPESLARFARYGRLQTTVELNAADCALLDGYFTANPDKVLRVWQRLDAKGAPPLALLARLPSLRELWIEANAGSLIDLAPLAALPDRLRALTLDTVAQFSDAKADRKKAHPEVLGRLRELEDFGLYGKLASLAFLGAMAPLEALALGRCGLKSLHGLEEQPALTRLFLAATGAKDLAPLGALTALERLTIDRHRDVDPAPLARLSSLRELWLLSSRLSAPLPDLSAMTALRVAVLDVELGASDLERIAAAPALRCLTIPRAKALYGVDALRPLAGHPTLQELRIDSWNERLWGEIRSAYGWKVAYCNYPAEEYLAD